MGVIVCDQHGRQPLAFACDHIRAVADPLRAGGIRVAVMFDGILTWEYAICGACAAASGLDRPGTKPSEVEDALADLAGEPECAQCEATSRWHRDVMAVVELHV